MVFLGSIGGQGRGTITIAICFIFLAYILHPLVESVYHRIRAYFAWRAIEDNRYVEVTDYPMVAEVVWGRGKMDAARLIAFALLLFSIASWGLELRLGLVPITDGDVDMFDRPPPVVFVDGSNGSWEVESKDAFNKKDTPKEGTLGNFRSTKDDGKDGTLEIGEATSLYRINGMRNRPIEGVIVTALWSTRVEDSDDDLYYNVHGGEGGGQANLKELKCTIEASQSEELYIRGEGGKWGNVTRCEQGPTTRSETEYIPPPTIILVDSNNKTYLIVEEVGSYPGFLYSVWNAERGDMESNTISHNFHIASRFRLVEAVVTGIVLGVSDGGGCVDLMFQFSEANSTYDENTKIRTQPFGERPGNNRGVDNLEKVEPIVRGVDADGLATSCLILLGIMSLIGVIWSFLLRSNIGMDVYDRDELIRAVTLTDQGDQERRSTAMRMFVRKDEMGRIDVIISDTRSSEGFCGALLKRPGVVAQEEPAVATAVVEGSDNPIPAGPTQIRLEGMRMGLGRTNFPRGYGPRSYSLTSSPIPSTMCTPMNRTPARGREREINELEARATAEGRKALNETVSVGDSARTILTDRSGYTSNLTASALQGCRGEGVLPPLPSTAQVPRQAGISSTTSTSRPMRRLNILSSLSNLSSSSNSTEANPEDSDLDTTFSSVNNG